MPLYFGIARNRPNVQILIRVFNRGLAKTKRIGDYARILKRMPLTPD